MTKKYKILTEFTKDISYETPDVETYLQTKENISKYNLKLDINSKPLKNQIIEVNLISTFQETSLVRKKSNFEITYAAIVRVDENVTDKKEIKKIILIDIPSEIYPRLEDLFVSLVNKAGFPDVKIERRIDFEKLYNEKFN
jgi:preprotein translocase subunit SecB|tara:strand:+ start:1675 stop:2097 length:423 start_codon:yes stop_codon:yes gene_type:complete